MIESIGELFQNFIAPQLESIKGEIKALDSKFEARIGALDSRFEMLDAKVGSFRAELLAEIRRVEEVLSSGSVPPYPDRKPHVRAVGQKDCETLAQGPRFL